MTPYVIFWTGVTIAGIIVWWITIKVLLESINRLIDVIERSQN